MKQVMKPLRTILILRIFFFINKKLMQFERTQIHIARVLKNIVRITYKYNNLNLINKYLKFHLKKLFFLKNNAYY